MSSENVHNVYDHLLTYMRWMAADGYKSNFLDHDACVEVCSVIKNHCSEAFNETDTTKKTGQPTIASVTIAGASKNG